jgi:hypothetical protein
MEGIEPVGVMQRVGLGGLVTVFRNLHDSQDGGVLLDPAQPGLAGQPCGDGFAARLMRGDNAARAGQGGHSDGRCWWLVEPCTEKSRDHLAAAFLSEGNSVLVSHMARMTLPLGGRLADDRSAA